MMFDNVVQTIKPEKDSQYRLKNCGCGSDNVAYIMGVDGNWRGRCLDCGRTGEGSKVQHKAQGFWNGVRA